jgi:hypothetical protein
MREVLTLRRVARGTGQRREHGAGEADESE